MDLQICTDASSLQGLRTLLGFGFMVAGIALLIDAWKFGVNLPPPPPTGRPGPWCWRHRCPIGECISQHDEESNSQ